MLRPVLVCVLASVCTFCYVFVMPEVVFLSFLDYCTSCIPCLTFPAHHYLLHHVTPGGRDDQEEWLNPPIISHLVTACPFFSVHEYTLVPVLVSRFTSPLLNQTVIL